MNRNKLNDTAASYRRALEVERRAIDHMLLLDPAERGQARREYEKAVQERARLGQLLLDAGRQLPPPSEFGQLK
jgi:hypothetical protein